ncbi:MAG: hypothetical protein AB7S78_12600 [Candidatus Omnitrophota bacterium]
MSSGIILKEPNKRTERQGNIITLMSDPFKRLILLYLHQFPNENESKIAQNLEISRDQLDSELDLLDKHRIITRTDKGFKLADWIDKYFTIELFSLDFLIGKTVKTDDKKVSEPLKHSYEVKSLLGKGNSSYTFLAKETMLDRDRTLKIFLPGTVSWEKLRRALVMRSKLKHPALPEVIEMGELNIELPEGKEVVLNCVVFENIPVSAKTFLEFLKSQENITSKFFDRFIQRIGGAMAEIEKAGLIHGDLHERNILVDFTSVSTVEMSNIEFWLIDFIGIPSSSSPQLEVKSDLENFRNHLLKVALLACEKCPGNPARYILGEKVYSILQNLMENKFSSFQEIMRVFNQPEASVPENFFKVPVEKPFEWLRVEWIPTAGKLYKLFEPDAARFDVISRFGNTLISGPRGCGKSHYLRVLAFNPQVIIQSQDDLELRERLEQIRYNFQNSFGVLFTCRLGEFKVFTPQAIGQDIFDPETQRILKHILVLKIWNKTFEEIKKGLECVDPVSKRPIIQIPNDYQLLIKFLEERLGKLILVDPENPINIFHQILAVCVAQESSIIANWYRIGERKISHFFDERDLDSFFFVIKQLFGELRSTRFFILVDDASQGNMHFEMQKILNSLVRSVQENHCFKITYDKYMYTIDSSDGRAIDPRHEATYVDLGEVSTKTQRDTSKNLSKYMARVIDTRLKSAGFNESIVNILGESQSSEEFLRGLSQPGARRPKKGESTKKRPPRGKAYYAGWNIISSISHGSIRTLLELVEQIFSHNSVQPGSGKVSLRDQDVVVRTHAKTLFKALSNIPGEVDNTSLGNALFSVISSIGELSRRYLVEYKTEEENRWYETISFERLDGDSLSAEAKLILDGLIQWGLVLDEGVTFSRAQIGLSRRYDLNKIFAPAFGITYRVRNHIYLSTDRLEELLLKPTKFIERHRRKLRDLAEGKVASQQGTLFPEK